MKKIYILLLFLVLSLPGTAQQIFIDKADNTETVAKEYCDRDKRFVYHKKEWFNMGMPKGKELEALVKHWLSEDEKNGVDYSALNDDYYDYIKSVCLKNNVKIHVSDLNKHFGKLKVLNGITVDIYEGEVVVVIGPSGSGKTTIGRAIVRINPVLFG